MGSDLLVSRVGTTSSSSAIVSSIPDNPLNWWSFQRPGYRVSPSTPFLSRCFSTTLSSASFHFIIRPWTDGAREHGKDGPCSEGFRGVGQTRWAGNGVSFDDGESVTGLLFWGGLVGSGLSETPVWILTLLISGRL